MCATCGCHEHSHQPVETSRMVKVEQDLLAKNDRHAAANRRWLARRGVTMFNLMASPGAGKTSLLVRTLQELGDEVAFAVIEGDQQTRLDAERIEACGIPVQQVNTGKGCHLDAHQVGHALTDLDPPEGSVVLVENVGNLVCPAGFDLGEQARVVLLSVTEGEDKPLKYPHMFHHADLVILTKTDLLPYVEFDVSRCIEHARRLRPGVPVLQLSVKTGEGLASWYAWMQAQRRHQVEARLAQA
ncbi:MAG TPA: hydrogenase accessory protein HypB [Sedimenticola sp.]|nr:hydrogenase accessory protein HypB [Sedimenticola sp.]